VSRAGRTARQALPRLLVVHHTTSPTLQAMLEAVMSGATDEAIEAIAQGLRWRRAQAPVTVVGDPGREDLQACWELGAAMAAGLGLP
jgi:hypothetical protein